MHAGLAYALGLLYYLLTATGALGSVLTVNNSFSSDSFFQVPVNTAPITVALPKKFKPKVFIVAMYVGEANIWHNIPEFDILALNITIPGLLPLFPEAHCTSDGTVCQIVLGEGEINAALTITALIHSFLFDLTSTYFLIAGVAGVSPEYATLGSVTFAKYAVQVALQFELDGREKPSEFPTGYIPQGTSGPGQYPTRLYGTEVFELNDDLRMHAFRFATSAKLNDTPLAQAYRANYAGIPKFSAASSPPSVVLCDTATSDNFWSGTLLAEAFANYTTLITNGTAHYCSSQQEDNATLTALLRASKIGLLDFTRIVIMRTGSDFDRPYPGQSAAECLLSDPTGFVPALQNVYQVGVKVVMGILDGWEDTFKEGVEPMNYVGDIWGTLGGEPDFGPGSIFRKERKFVR